MSRILGRGKTALRWNGPAVGDKAEAIAKRIMGERLLLAKELSWDRLYVGHGVDTSTMKVRIHVAPGGYNWASDHIEPTEAATPLNDDLAPANVRGKWSLELGSGQKYAIYYHQKHDAFLRIPFDSVMRGFRTEVNKEWRSTFR